LKPLPWLWPLDQRQRRHLSWQSPLEPALRDYILLITILVAFLEANAQQLTPIQPEVVMRFSGVSRGDKFMIEC
jgi:hypothetical protein